MYNYSAMAREAAAKLTPKTVSAASHAIGMQNDEPLIVMMDCLYRYARNYKKRYENGLCEDYVLGPEWLAAAKGVRGLLNGDGAIASEIDRTTDSKDNGTVEAMFWAAMEEAGFKEEDM